MIDDVVALYVDPRGPYPKLVREWYDETRDARTYAGPWPAVAHPPCGPWGRLKHLFRSDPIRNDREASVAHLAIHALGIVRRYGGVLEHPAHSTLWTVAALRLPEPGELPDAWGGRTFEVQQCDWGHPARKKTWLYMVRCSPTSWPRTGQPTHWVSGVQTPGKRGKPPPGIKICSAQQRRRTPVAFAEWLLALARTANKESRHAV